MNAVLVIDLHHDTLIMSKPKAMKFSVRIVTVQQLTSLTDCSAKDFLDFSSSLNEKFSVSVSDINHHLTWQATAG